VPTGWYLPEAAHPYYKFVEAGAKVTFCSISGTALCDPSSIEFAKDDEICTKFYADESLKAQTSKQPKLADMTVTDFDVLFFVGGFGTMWDFPDSPDVLAAIKTMYATEGKIVAAVCHGPCCFFNAKLEDGTPLVKGKEVTGFTNGEENYCSRYETVSKPTGPGSCEDVFGELGAKYQDGGVFKEKVCVGEPGKLYTGQNPPSAGPLATEILKALA